MTVCGHFTLASLAGTRSASSLSFPLIKNMSSPDDNENENYTNWTERFKRKSLVAFCTLIKSDIVVRII